jgi:hypothetical protein
MTTRVININSKEHDVYFGREIRWETIYPQSKWHNPFPIDKDAPNKDKERQRVITKFRE